MKRIAKISAGLLICLASTAAWAGVITIDVSYSGPISGTGVFSYDDQTDAISQWSWSFPGVGSANGSYVPLTGSGSIIADVLLGTSTIVTSVTLDSTDISGFPGDSGRDFVHFTNCTFFMGDPASGRGLTGSFLASVRAVPEPGALGLIGAGLLVAGLIRRRRTA